MTSARIRPLPGPTLPPRRARHRPRGQPLDLVELLTTGALALLGLQLDLGLTFRFAPTDALASAAAALLLLRGGKHISGRALFLPFVLGTTVAGAAFVGTIRSTLYTEALVDRGLGAVALLAICVVTAASRPAVIIQGLRWAGWVTIVLHLSVMAGVPLAPQKVPSRNSGGLFDPNNAGILAAFLLCFELYSLVFPSGERRTSLRQLLKVVLLAVALISTTSRTAWISAAAGTAVIVVTSLVPRLLRLEPAGASVSRRQARIGWLLGFGVILVSLLASQAQQFEDEFASRPDNLAKRRPVFDASLTAFVDNPYTGGGLLHTLEKGIGFPHDSVLWLAGDAGIIGLLAFAAIAVLPVRWLRHGQNRPTGAAISATLILSLHVVMLTSSLTVETLYQRHWWVAIGLAAAHPGLSAPRLAPRSRRPRGDPP